MDPITIGAAFTVAQTAIGSIKKAVAMGKDVQSIIGDVTKFFEASNQVHTAAVHSKGKNLGKTDAELGKQALEIAMQSHTLRKAEEDLKNMLYWELQIPHVWDEMVRVRNQLIQDRNAAERKAVRERAQRRKELGEALELLVIVATTVFGVAALATIVYVILRG